MTLILPTTRDAIAALIPHQGGMCLLDGVLAVDQQHILCRSHTHLDSNHVLHVGQRLSSLVLCEYGAQAVAVHGALQPRLTDAETDNHTARPGMLVAMRDVQLRYDYWDEVVSAFPHAAQAPLRVRAEQEQHSDTGCIYRFIVSLEQPAITLVSGRVTIMNGSAP